MRFIVDRLLVGRMRKGCKGFIISPSIHRTGWYFFFFSPCYQADQWSPTNNTLTDHNLVYPWTMTGKKGLCRCLLTLWYRRTSMMDRVADDPCIIMDSSLSCRISYCTYLPGFQMWKQKGRRGSSIGVGCPFACPGPATRPFRGNGDDGSRNGMTDSAFARGSFGLPRSAVGWSGRPREVGEMKGKRLKREIFDLLDRVSIRYYCQFLYL